MLVRINPKAEGLLKSWYFMTREANFKSCYPAICVKWEKRGLAWHSVGVGFDLSRGTGPVDIREWEEAGHQFGKLPDIQQALIVGNTFHDWTITELREVCRQPRHKIEGAIRVGLRKYESLCLDVGLIDWEADMTKYLAGLKLIAQYFGVSTKTIRRWTDDAGLPVRKVDGGSMIANKDELDQWFCDNCDRVGV